ncbi:DUF2062 domain-containing protein [Bacillus sp. REN10]|uniref:DUF2062 domain-containing protein n=1 Tax=Bacillus sp. REN10 TaxID=2782541 RepID=UPI00193BCF46|nr:DUF2062 domain-containing protein [Bacillus sp. REN10]
MIQTIQRRVKYLLLKFFRLKGSAHSISIGFTLGASINFVPSFGVGVLVSVAIAKLFKGNPIAGFLGGISLMWVFPVLFYLNLLTGRFVFPDDLGDVIEQVANHSASLDQSLLTSLSLGRTFMIGMLINIAIFICLLYPPIYIISKRYQKKILQYIYIKWVKRPAIQR